MGMFSEADAAGRSFIATLESYMHPLSFLSSRSTHRQLDDPCFYLRRSGTELPNHLQHLWTWPIWIGKMDSAA